MNRERRKHTRITMDTGGEGILRGSVSVIIRNVSAGGLSFETTTSLRPGAVYELKGEIPGLLLNAQVVVTRCVASGSVSDGKGGRSILYSAGAALVQVPEAQQSNLQSWLADHGARAPLAASASLSAG